MKETFADIVSINNLKSAYFEIAKKFDAHAKSSRYFGIDASVLNDYNYTSDELLKEISEEMQSFQTIAPAVGLSIPKKNGGKRDIYVYGIKERIKAQAIYRVLEPIIDEILAPYIYSYRASHPSYYAARSAVRRYKRQYGHNYIFTADVSDYSNSIDHEILFQKLQECGFDANTIRIVTLFVRGQMLVNGQIITPTKGVMTGTPLYGILSNLYLNEFDLWAGKSVAMYRRVGDDIIAIDSNREKVEVIYEQLKQTVARNKISLNETKVFLGPDSEHFVFLGYYFHDGKIAFDPKSLRKILLKWKIDLNRYPGNNLTRKLEHMKYLIATRPDDLDQEFDQLIQQKMLVDDQENIKQFSEQFFQMLTKYFFGVYTPKYRRQLYRLCRDIKVGSFFRHFNNIHFPSQYGKS